MFTKEQEAYLTKLADMGIAEQAEAEARNAGIELATKIQEARDAKVSELKKQAQELIDKGLEDFELNELPKIK